jgi:DNA-binding PadR family transcriptional regulator
MALADGVAWKQWTRGSSQLKGPLLALLLESPGCPSQLAGRLHTLAGEAWQVDPKDAYPIMERLEGLGLASSVWRYDSKARRDLKEYHATELTAKAVEEWMQSPLPRMPVRLEVATRVAVSQPRYARHILRALDEFEQACTEELGEHARECSMHTWEGLEMEVTRRRVTMRIESDFTWIDFTRGAIEEFPSVRDGSAFV